MASAGIVQSLGDLFFKISPDMGDFGTQLEAGVAIAAGSTIATVGTAIEALGKAITKKFTLPLAVATAANIAQFQALDREIRSTLTLFGTSPALIDETWNEMSAGIREVSMEVGGLEKEIADGLYQTISAGIPRGDAFEFLETAQMAAFADKTADLTTAVDGITTAMNAFSAEGLEATEVSDIMFATVAKGKTTFGELSQSMGRAAGLAANAGVSFAEFSATIGTITLGGFQTSEAVSFLRAAITGLLRPGEEMNRVFQDLGYASAEAAIPIIGLQPAFQAVVDATGGSTSALQELIGTAEGVSAILSVTGDNADKFSGVMRGVENSTGATTRAFEIADAGVGRTFGKMTEAFDRLANTFGEWGSALAEPVIKAITAIVDALTNMMSVFKPVVDGLAAGLGLLMKAFDIPIVKQFAAGIAAVALALSATLGLLGPLIWAVGALFVAYSKLRATIWVVKFLKGSFKGLQTATDAVGTSVERLADKLKKGGKASGSMEKSTRGLAKVLKMMKTQALIAGLAIGAIVVAIGIAIFAYTKMKDKIKEIESQTLVTVQGVERIAASLNETLGEIGAINTEIEEPTEFITKFSLKNEGVVTAINETVRLVSEAAAEDQIIGIAFEAHRRGMSEDGVRTLVSSFQTLSNLDFVFDFDALSAADQIGQLDAQLAKVGERLSRSSASTFEMFGSFTTAHGDVKELADQLVNVYTTQGAGQFETQLAKIGKTFVGDANAANYFADEVLKSFEEVEGTKLDFDLGSGLSTSLTTVNDVLTQLQSKDWYTNVPTQAEAAVSSIQTVDEAFAESARQSAGDQMALLKDPEKLKIAEELAVEMADAFAAAEQHIYAAFTAIETGILNSMPMLDIYTGAVEQSFDKWLAGQKQFQEDIVNVAEFRDKLKAEVPKAVVDAFDQQPLSKQAWLATLGEEQQSEALEALTASNEAAYSAINTVWHQDFPGVVAEANTIIQGEYDRLMAQALTSGAGVSVNFANSFNEGAKQWPGIAQHWMNAVATIIGGGSVGSVTMAGPDINANINVTNTSVTVTSTSPSAATQVTQGLQTAGHQQ